MAYRDMARARQRGRTSAAADSSSAARASVSRGQAAVLRRPRCMAGCVWPRYETPMHCRLHRGSRTGARTRRDLAPGRQSIYLRSRSSSALLGKHIERGWRQWLDALVHPSPHIATVGDRANAATVAAVAVVVASAAADLDWLWPSQ